MRFDQTAEFLAQHFGFIEQQGQFKDRVWVGDNFLEEVRTSGREGDRRTLTIHRHGMFLTLTVNKDVTLAEVRELLWAVDRALDCE